MPRLGRILRRQQSLDVSGSAVEFTPPDIAGLALWLEANLGVSGTAPAPVVFRGTNAAAAASVTVTEAVSAGDTLVVVVPSATVPTDNAAGGSNTYVLQNSVTGQDVYTCVSAKAALAGALVITASAVSVISYAHYSGVGSIDASSTGALGASSVPNPGSLTPTGAGETIVAVTLAATVETAGAGYALRAAGTATTPAWQDLIGAAGGANATAFGTSATAWTASAVALVPKSVAGATTWLDQSGSSHNATAGALRAPIVSANTYNGLPALSGADGTRGLGFASLPNLTTTGSLVLTFSGSSLTFTYLMAAGGGGSGILQSFTTTLLQYFLAGGTETDTIAASVTAGLHQVIVSQVDGVSLNIWYDGALIISKVPAATINVTWNQLFGDGSSANGTNGDIVQVMEYVGTAVNATQAAQLHAYTKAKWGSP